MNTLSTNLLSQLADISTNILIGLSGALTITYLNTRAKNFFGIDHTSTSYLDEDFSEFCQRFDCACPIDNLGRTLTSKNHAGDKFYLLWQAAETQTHSNEETAILLVGEEIKIKPNNFVKNLEAIVNCTPGSLYWKDHSGRYLGCNQFMVDTAGKSSTDEIIGYTDQELWPTYADAIRENDAYVIATGKTLQTEEQVEVPNHGLMIFASVKMPLLDSGGRTVGIIGNSIDITAQKRMLEMQQEQLKLEHDREQTQKYADRMKMLAASIAHEMRTPMTAILGGAEGISRYLDKLVEGYRLAEDNGLLTDLPVRPAQLTLLTQVVPNIISLSQQCHQIITMHLRNLRYDDIPRDDFTVLSMQEVINHAVSLYPFKNQQAELVHTDLANDFTFEGDRHLMCHVIWNLLKNALYFIRAQEKGDISLTLVREEDTGILLFKDTAKGMSEATRAKVFEAFYTKTEGGTGLGLTFCQSAIEAFGGSMTCEAELGKHTTFVITLPLAPDDTTQ